MTLITVIVTAFDRRNYLIDAIHSLVTQSLERSSYEIIVVKNFTDERIDKYLRGQGVRCVIETSVNFGSTLARGLELASGDVVAFLNDDDLFENQKLETIGRLFRDPGLTYYHNSMSWMDSTGKPINDSLLRQPSKEIRALGPKSAVIQQLRRLNCDVNESCIAMRREAIVPYLPYLRRLPINQDVFLFLCALDYGGWIVADTGRLTRYRVHSSSSRLPTLYADFLRSAPKLKARYVDSFTVMNDAFGSGRLSKVVRLDRAMAALELFVVANGQMPFPGLSAVVPILTSVVESPALYRLVMLALATTGILSPQLASQVYFRLRYNPMALRLSGRL